MLNNVDYKYLVVGADGFIGAGLSAFLDGIGASVTRTSRRKERVNSKCIFLDLADEETFDVVESGNYACAFLCSGITAIALCEAEPERTYRINVTNTLNLAKRLSAAGTKIIFLSSNTVFDGETAWPEESAEYSPCIEYGRQKAAVERELMSSGEVAVAIVRLSKVLTPASGMTAEFFGKLAAGEPCRAFDDLRMSPVSLEYVTNALMVVASSKLSGIFHLSGFEEMSYADFACRLATHIGADPALVRPVSSVAAQATVLFRPRHPALGMRRTRELLVIEPEPIAHLMSALVGQKV